MSRNPFELLKSSLLVDLDQFKLIQINLNRSKKPFLSVRVGLRSVLD